MLRAKTLKNLALTLGIEKAVDDSLAFKKYYIPVNIEQHDKWVMECTKLETAGMLKPDTNNGMCPDTCMVWHGYTGTKFDRIGVIIFRSEVCISYKTKSALDRM